MMMLLMYLLANGIFNAQVKILTARRLVLYDEEYKKARRGGGLKNNFLKLPAMTSIVEWSVELVVRVV